MRKLVLFIICLCVKISIWGSNFSIDLLPYPQEIVQKEGRFDFPNIVKIASDPLLKKEMVFLQKLLTDEFGLITKVVSKGNSDIYFHSGSRLVPKHQEAYRLLVSDRKITIEANDASGAFYAIQSLRQILRKEDNKVIVPQCEIIDYPTLTWRSFMLDEGRYFKGEQAVKQLLDEMARLKMNIFQWHLTDDQGWRIEIKKYPLLTEIGGRRDSTQLDWYESQKYDGVSHTGFYTQKQIRDIVAYAAQRHITIVPEIEMPGHSAAAIAAYPWLSASRKEIRVPCKFGVQYDVFNVADPKVLGFLEDVLDEVMTLFPSKVIHIGGDEVRYDQWNQSEEVQRFIRDKGLASASDLQVWFTNWMSKIITQKGRRMMGWNDITGEKLHHFQEGDAEGTAVLSPGTIVQFWKGDAEMMARAASKGNEIVNSYNDFTYLNYSYEYDAVQATYEFKPISLKRAYEFSPIPEGFPKALVSKVVGAGCQMWGEWIPTIESMNYMVYPRLAAYAEVFWLAPEKKEYPRFRKGLNSFLKRWKEAGIVYGPVID